MQMPDAQLPSIVSRKAFELAEEILEVDGSTTSSASSRCTRYGSPRTCVQMIDSDLELESTAGWSSPASPFSTIASPGRWASWLDIDSVLHAVEVEQAYPFAPSLSTRSAVCSYTCYEDKSECNEEIEAVSPASMPVRNTVNMSMLMQLAERSSDHFCSQIPLRTPSPETDSTSTAHFVLQNSRIPLLPLHHTHDAPSLLSARQQPTSPTLARFSRDGSTVGAHTARSFRVEEEAGSDIVFVQYGDASPDLQEFTSGAASPAGFVGLLLQNDDGEVDNERITRAIRRMLGLESPEDAVQLLRLTETEIQRLPKVRFSSTEEEQCAICLESFQEDEVLTSLRCGHFFHVQCATLWMQQATHCPLCRQSCVQ